MKKEIICGIYKITSPTGCIYIGQSRNCYYRESKYRGGDCRGQHRLHRSISKYGWESHKFEIIHKCAEPELNYLEKYYVDKFGTFNSKHGLNLRDGGGCTGKASEETKMLNSKSLKRAYRLGIKERPIGEKNGMYGNGYKLSGEKNGRYRKLVTTETRQRQSAGILNHYEINGTRKHTEEEKLHLAKLKTSKGGKDGTIGRFYGVYKIVGSKKFYCYLRVNGKRTYFGAFISETEAASSINKAQLKHFGEIRFYNEV